MSENSNIVQLDIIPIYKNEMYPTKKEMWHLENENPNNISKYILLNYMFEEIKHKFWNYDVVIILEKGKVIEIIK